MKTTKMIFITLLLLVSVNLKSIDEKVKANHNKKTIFDYINEVRDVQEDIEEEDSYEDDDDEDQKVSYTTLTTAIAGGKTLKCTKYSDNHKFSGIYKCSVSKPDPNNTSRPFIAFYTHNGQSKEIYEALQKRRTDLLPGRK